MLAAGARVPGLADALSCLGAAAPVAVAAVAGVDAVRAPAPRVTSWNTAGWTLNSVCPRLGCSGSSGTGTALPPPRGLFSSITISLLDRRTNTAAGENPAGQRKQVLH